MCLLYTLCANDDLQYSHNDVPEQTSTLPLQLAINYINYITHL